MCSRLSEYLKKVPLRIFVLEKKKGAGKNHIGVLCGSFHLNKTTFKNINFIVLQPMTFTLR